MSTAFIRELEQCVPDDFALRGKTRGLDSQRSIDRIRKEDGNVAFDACLTSTLKTEPVSHFLDVVPLSHRTNRVKLPDSKKCCKQQVHCTLSFKIDF